MGSTLSTPPPPVPTPFDLTAQIEAQKIIEKVLLSLTPREETVLKMRFGLDDGYEHTLKEIGESFQLSRERIRHIEARGFRKLRYQGHQKGSLLQAAANLLNVPTGGEPPGQSIGRREPMSEEEKAIATAEDAEKPTEEKEASVAEAPETTEESATSDEQGQDADEASGDEEKDEEGKPKRKGGFQRRIDKLTARLHAKDEELEYYRRKTLERDGQPQPKAETPAAKPKPKPEDFRLDDGETYDHAAYTEALSNWTAEEAVRKYAAEQEAKAKETQARTEADKRITEYEKREVAFAESVEDFEEVAAVAIGTLKKLGVPPGAAAISEVVLESDAGPEILYYLGQNPDEARQIAQLSFTRAMLALGQLEAQLAEQEEEKGEKTQTPPPVSRAPKPPVPIKKPAATSKLRPDDPNDAEKMSAEEWRKARDEQERQRIRAQRGK